MTTELGTDAPVTPRQHAFLRYFLDGPPARRVWLCARGRVIAGAEDCGNLPEGAEFIEINRREAADGPNFAGAPKDRKRLRVADLGALSPYWDVPLQTLNERGLDLARRLGIEQSVKRTFVLPASLDKLLEQRAKAVGQMVSPYLCALVGREVLPRG